MTTPEPTAWAHADLPAWEARGRHVEVLGHRVFVVDVPAARPDADDPLVVVHGFRLTARGAER